MARFFGLTVVLFVSILVLDSGLVRCQDIPIPPIPPEIEGRCLLPGVAFLQGCDAYTQEAFDYFGIESVEQEGIEISVEEVQEFFDQAGPPGPGCCKAACDYANTICNCEPVATAWGGDLFFGADNYAAFVRTFQKFCNFVDLIDNCPEGTAEEVAMNNPPNDCEALGAVAATPAPDTEEEEELDLEEDLDG